MENRRQVESNTRAPVEKVEKQTKKSAGEKTTKTIRSKQVTVTFNVTVPDQPGVGRQPVFLVGTLRHFSPSLPDWGPRGIEMKKIDSRRWTVTLMGQPDTLIEYKYALGSWEHVEKDSHCHEVQNRRVTLNDSAKDAQVVEDTVQNWRGIGCRE